MNPLRFTVASLLIVASAASLPGAEARPVAAAFTAAAAKIPAGGFVWAEIEGATVAFGQAGKLPADTVPAERRLFEIGSITKLFTGLLLAQAVLENKAALDDSIAKHLPADLKLDPAVAAITLVQLATHTSGLPSLPANFAPADNADPYAGYTAARLHAALAALRPAAPAPQPAAYSNLGFGLLGHLLERIFGRPYADLVAARITGPLGLKDTVIVPDADQQRRFAPAHSGTMAVKPWTFDALAGAGALRSTAADLAKFAQALLSGENPQLAAAWALARRPHASFASRQADIGLAVFIGRRDGRTIYNHGGGTGGFRSLLELDPAAGRAVVVLLNNDDPDPAAVLAAGRRPAAPPAAQADARPEKIIPREQVAAFAGIFAIDERTRFTFVLDDAGRLRGRLTGQGFLPLFHAGDDRFFARSVAAEFQFARDAAGAVTGVALHQNGNTVPAKRTPAAVPVLLFPSAAKLRDYAGRFTLAPGAVFEVSARGDTLLVKLTGQPALPVHCEAPDRFVYEVVPAALTFERNPAGRVSAVVLHQNGRDQRAPRLEPSAQP